MQKRKFLLVIMIAVIAMSLTSCTKNKSKDVSVENVMKELKSTANFKNGEEEDITDLDIAERYGISPNDVKEGTLYYSEDENSADKIVLVKAKEQDSVENIERALGNEVVGLTDAWEGNATESKKVEEHVLKTKDKFVILIVGDNAKKIEEKFDKLV